MRRVLFVMLAGTILGTACSSAHSGGPQSIDWAPTSQSDPGASTPDSAIKAFMAAVNSQNLDDLSIIWGSEKGPTRDGPNQDQLKKREMVMVCYLQHDSYRILSRVEQEKGLYVVSFEITKGAVAEITERSGESSESKSASS